MSEPIDKPSSRETVGSTSTTSNVAKGGAKRKDYLKRSVVWNHFTEFEGVDGKKKCKCNYCSKEYSCSSKSCGTSTLMNHMRSCVLNPANQAHTDGQTHLAFNSMKLEETGEVKVSLNAWKFCQKTSRKALAQMIIVDELPFKFVENEGFRKFMKVVQPSLMVLSRYTIKRDCYELYVGEKEKLKAKLKNSTLRISLTTDTWTSVQQINYMCLTAHYIDHDWTLHKKIINFCPIVSHKGYDIGRAVELCLIDWGIQNVLTVTVDNASSNDTCLKYLKGKFEKWGNLCILKGKWTHVRCMAHVMNLIVQDGIREVKGSVERVRMSVRYIRQSPNRIRKFKELAKLENIDSDKSLCLDVPTRWNSTYLMLSVALTYERAFDRLAIEDSTYENELTSGPGIPCTSDWDNIRLLVPFLQHFYQLTLRVSGTKYITSNTFLDSVSCMNSVLKDCFSSENTDRRGMSSRMKLKFDKYWGDIEKFNLMLFLASVFDPRTKFDYLEVTLCNMYGDMDGEKIAFMCKNALYELFSEYKRIHSDDNSKNVSPETRTSSSSTVASQSFSDVPLFGNSDDAIRSVREKMLAEVKRRKAESGIAQDTKSELDRYLTEDIEEDEAWFQRDDFSVLGWWKRRSPAFPILSLIARDILAILISTVASESTFSTGGRVFDSFRSSLTPKTVQALICTQDWLRENDASMNVEELVE